MSSGWRCWRTFSPLLIPCYHFFLWTQRTFLQFSLSVALVVLLLLRLFLILMISFHLGSELAVKGNCDVKVLLWIMFLVPDRNVLFLSGLISSLAFLDQVSFSIVLFWWRYKGILPSLLELKCELFHGSVFLLSILFWYSPFFPCVLTNLSNILPFLLFLVQPLIPPAARGNLVCVLMLPSLFFLYFPYCYSIPLMSFFKFWSFVWTSSLNRPFTAFNLFEWHLFIFAALTAVLRIQFPGRRV